MTSGTMGVDGRASDAPLRSSSSYPAVLAGGSSTDTHTPPSGSGRSVVGSLHEEPPAALRGMAKQQRRPASHVPGASSKSAESAAAAAHGILVARLEAQRSKSFSAGCRPRSTLALRSGDVGDSSGSGRRPAAAAAAADAEQAGPSAALPAEWALQSIGMMKQTIIVDMVRSGESRAGRC